MVIAFLSLTPEVVVQSKPSSYCACLAVDSGRALAAVGGRDGIVHLWSLNSHRELRRLEGHTDSVTSMTFSADGRYLLSSSLDGTARLWSLATGTEVRHFDAARFELVPAKIGADGRMVPSTIRRMPVQVTGAGFLGSNSVVASDTSGTIWRWRVDDGKPMWSMIPVRDVPADSISTGPFLHPTPKQIQQATDYARAAMGVVVAFDGESIYGAARCGVTFRLDAKNGAVMSTARTVTGGVLAVSALDPGHVSLGMRGGRVAIVRTSDLSAEASWFASDGDVRSVVGNVDGRVLVAGDFGGARLMGAGGEGAVKIGPVEGQASCAAGGRGLLLVGRDSGVVDVFQAPSGAWLYTLAGRTVPLLTAKPLPNGCVVYASSDGFVRVADLIHLTTVMRLSTGASVLRGIDVSRSGRYLAMATHDGRIAVIDLQTGHRSGWFARSGGVEAVAFLTDNTLVAMPEIGTESQIWTTEGRFRGNYDGPYGETKAIAANKTGTLFAVASIDGLCLWKAGTMLPVWRRRAEALCLAFGAGGQVAFGEADGTLEVVIEKNGRSLRTCRWAATPVTAVGFAADGKSVFGANALGDVFQLVLATGKAVAVVQHAHSFGVRSLCAYGTNGLLTAGGDGVARAWQVPSGAMCGCLVADPLGTVFLGPDGHYYAERGAVDSIAFRVGYEAYPFDQFDLIYDRPDLVIREFAPFAALTASLRKASHAAAARLYDAYRQRAALVGVSPDSSVHGTSAPMVNGVWVR